MPLRKWLQAVAMTMACTGLLVPVQCLQADEPVAGEPPNGMVDVALGDDGSLVGVVVDAAGMPQANVPILIQQFETMVASATSNERGEFLCHLKSGGIYLFSTGDQVVMLRCWAPGTAPPNAQARLMVTASDVVRGQISPANCGLGNPWVITGIAVAAIAIPVALHNNRADREDGSE
jgi:hypothetical protein